MVSRMLCIERDGAPMSIVFIPALAAIMGPIVDPHIESFLTMNSYNGTPALSAMTLRMEEPTASVMYL